MLSSNVMTKRFFQAFRSPGLTFACYRRSKSLKKSLCHYVAAEHQLGLYFGVDNQFKDYELRSGQEETDECINYR